MPIDDPIASLRRTQSSAQALASKLAAYAPVMKQPPRSISRLMLVVPKAVQSLAPRLVDLGVEHGAATRVATAVMRASQDLRASFEEDFHRRQLSQTWAQAGCFDDSKSASLIPSVYDAVYSKTTNDWISYIIQEFTPRLLNVLSSRNGSVSPHASQRRRPFNQDAVPILERFFDDNAFPSRLEKYELASRCDMDYRQIHVWFQNRRSRCRKEGKELKQCRRHGVITEDLESTILETLLPTSMEDEESSDVSEEHHSSSSFSAVAAAFRPLVSVIEPPNHAFPTPYPPQCPNDPFPLDQHTRSFPLPWLRTIPPRIATLSTTVDISELVAAFSRLSIRCDRTDEGVTRKASSHLSSSSSSPSWHGSAIPCSQAPHPALIRRPRRLSRYPYTSGRLSACCESRLESAAQAWNSNTSPRRPRVHLTTTSTHSDQTELSLPSSAVRLPKRTLPMRYPKYPPSQGMSLHGTLPLGGCSGTSRLRSQSSHSARSISDVDSPLSTPPLEPISLPVGVADPPESSDPLWLSYTLSMSNTKPPSDSCEILNLLISNDTSP